MYLSNEDGSLIDFRVYITLAVYFSCYWMQNDVIMYDETMIRYQHSPIYGGLINMQLKVQFL